MEKLAASHLHTKGGHTTHVQGWIHRTPGALLQAILMQMKNGVSVKVKLEELLLAIGALPNTVKPALAVTCYKWSRAFSGHSDSSPAYLQAFPPLLSGDCDCNGVCCGIIGRGTVLS